MVPPCLFQFCFVIFCVKNNKYVVDFLFYVKVLSLSVQSTLDSSVDYSWSVTGPLNLYCMFGNFRRGEHGQKSKVKTKSGEANAFAK